ncbi:hypothetical protein ABZW30_10865 [Kitasatospora sp. NPDC004669]|uniref:hypothetical protein n=1 Tax=Kitasatospora sp. NPDC004669 TaxID=3154555 RepID=UPI0033AEE568
MPAVVLFTDATEARGCQPMGRSIGQGRLLSPALPASVALAILAGALLFPGRRRWLPAVAALVVMPMDLASALMFLRDEGVPARVRNALNVEGGYNVTVLLGVILHGVTPEPIARWFQRHPQPRTVPAEAGSTR